MDEFYMFLIIGLLTIAAMLILLVGDFGIDIGYYDTYGTTTTRTTTTYHTVTTSIPSNAEMIVGVQNVETWRNIRLGKVNTTYSSNEIKTIAGDKYIVNGLLFGKTSIEMSAYTDKENFVGAYIRFDVERANNYGNLIIKFNGNVIENRKFVPGSYTININSSMIGESNSIELVPTSSSWRLWAPTVYSLKNVEFVYQTHYSKMTEIPFTIYQEEANSMIGKRGRITLDLGEHSGKLKILLNGNQVYYEGVSGYQSIYFDESNLKLGQNSIKFLAEDYGNFIGDASMLIYYDTLRDNDAVSDIIINQSNYNKLMNEWGIISFDVTRVTNPGGLSVSITDQNGRKSILAYDTLSAKNYYFFFNSSYLSLGKNTVTIGPVDNSVFYVKDFSINI